jgi:hypothetical protein
VTVSSSSGLVRPHRFRWDRLVHASHRFLLPVLSGGCFFLGAVLLIHGPGALGRYAPLVFLVLGTVTLANSLAYLRGRYAEARIMGGNSESAASDTGSSDSSQRPSAAPPSLEWEALFYGRFEVPSRGEGTAFPLRVLFTPTSAADRLWVHWLPTEVGHLPMELATPFPSSAYLPSPSEVAPIQPPSSVGLPPDDGGSELEVAIILDPVLPPAGVQETSTRETTEGPIVLAVLEKPPAPSDPPTPPPAALGAERPWKAEPGTPHWMRSILAEATNPVPPHLRSDTHVPTERSPGEGDALGSALSASLGAP